jgi:hypothetical protein
MANQTIKKKTEMKKLSILICLLILLSGNTDAQTTVLPGEKEYVISISAHDINKGTQKHSDSVLMNVLVRGPLTLYSKVVVHRGSRTTKFTDIYYYVKRENEEAAIEIAYSNNSFSSFHSHAHKYFADSPSISERIKKRVKGYTVINIKAIVEEYNTEKSN